MTNDSTDFLMGDTEDDQQRKLAASGPFGKGAPVYAPLEYTGMVPVRTKGKKAKTIAMKGVSGRKGMQTLPKHYTGPNALPEYKDHNIGWRLPYGIIGIDIDQYDDKHGADDLKELETGLGPLPDTWSSTARGDGPSRIYFYRVPEDCGELRGSLSESIEIIQHHHRYAMVWPSVHEKTGNTYAWYNGVRSDTPPVLDQLADLPEAWLDHLSKTQREHRDGMGLDVEAFRQAYTEQSDPDLVQRIRDQFDTTPSCRHDSMVRVLGWACREATYGKINAGDTFDLLAADWDEATAGEGREDEFDAMVRDIVLDTPEPDEAEDDLYEPEEPEPSEYPELDGLSKEERIETMRILKYEAARERARQIKARQVAASSPAPTVSDALDELLSGSVMDVPSVGAIEGHLRGWGLFYPEHINGMFGDQSVGKSVIMAELQARELRNGGTVVHWEFDNNPIKSILKRLLDAGAEPDAIRTRFHVLFDQALADSIKDEARHACSLVTLDAMNPAVTSFQLDPYTSTGIDTVLHKCLRPFTLNGACGIFLDHVGHENKERQHGAIRKSQAVQGALYEAVKVTSLKPGTVGRTRMVLRKDNRGSLGDMEGRSLAVAVMTSHADTGGLAGRVGTAFTEPDPFNDPNARPTGSPTTDQNVRRIIKEMDDREVPADLSQRATRSWELDHGGKIQGRNEDWREAWSSRQKRSSSNTPPTGPE
jgi:hypothetical protein